MESNKNHSGYYQALIWLLLTSYEDGVYTPSKFLLDTLKPKIEESTDLPLLIMDSTLYDFKITSGFKQYLDLFFDTTSKFETSLVILSYSQEKYIVRDFYMANLAKAYTCWDTVYLNCPLNHNITTSTFDYILTSDELPSGLEKIIWQQKDQ